LRETTARFCNFYNRKNQKMEGLVKDFWPPHRHLYRASEEDVRLQTGPFSARMSLGALSFCNIPHRDGKSVSGIQTHSAASRIIGKFQLLKYLNHPNLCEYVEVVKGRHGEQGVVRWSYQPDNTNVVH
jgi:hypothetical protein